MHKRVPLLMTVFLCLTTLCATACKGEPTDSSTNSSSHTTHSVADSSLNGETSSIEESSLECENSSTEDTWSDENVDDDGWT